MSEAKVAAFFRWINTTPDPRPFQQQRHLLETGILVVVEIPLKHEYIYNSEDIIQAQIAANDIPALILTPLGMQYAVAELEKPWPINENLGKESIDEETKDFDWDENEDAATSNSTEDAFDWDKETVTDEDNSEPMTDEEFEWDE